MAFNPPGSPMYSPSSPQYSPSSPQYSPNSPRYSPTSPQRDATAFNPPNSPGYNPMSPQYSPASPQRTDAMTISPPGSPQYCPSWPPTIPNASNMEQSTPVKTTDDLEEHDDETQPANRPIHCFLCDRVLTTRGHYRQHTNGQEHKDNVRKTGANNTVRSRKRLAFDDPRNLDGSPIAKKLFRTDEKAASDVKNGIPVPSALASMTLGELFGTANKPCVITSATKLLDAERTLKHELEQAQQQAMIILEEKKTKIAERPQLEADIVKYREEADTAEAAFEDAKEIFENATWEVGTAESVLAQNERDEDDLTDKHAHLLQAIETKKERYEKAKNDTKHFGQEGELNAKMLGIVSKPNTGADREMLRRLAESSDWFYTANAYGKISNFHHGYIGADVRGNFKHHENQLPQKCSICTESMTAPPSTVYYSAACVHVFHHDCILDYARRLPHNLDREPKDMTAPCPECRSMLLFKKGRTFIPPENAANAVPRLENIKA